MHSFIISFNHTQQIFLTFTTILIVTDYICGIVKALKNHTFKSSLMRSGLATKFSYLVCMFLAWCMEIFTRSLNLGFQWTSFGPVCIGIILIEFSSILENLTEINPKLKNSEMLQALDVVHDLDDKGDKK